MCETCGREVRALERVIALLTYDEKRAAEVTFRESVTEGACCIDRVPGD